MDECTRGCKATKYLFLGIVVILVRIFYNAWDIWIVLGALVIIKAIYMYIFPSCSCNTKSKKKKK